MYQKNSCNRFNNAIDKKNFGVNLAPQNQHTISMSYPYQIKSFEQYKEAYKQSVENPETFWGKAQTVVGASPAGTKVHAVYPSQDGKTGTCLWEAGSADEIQKFLDEAAEGLATNFCYEVNEAMAMGLPERKKEEVLN